MVWPALGVAARHYQRLARQVQQSGLTVAVGEYRGQSRSKAPVTRESRFGYSDLATEDMGGVAAELRSRFPGRDLLLFGHSLGGQLALALEVERPGSFDALILVSSGTPHWRTFPWQTRAIPAFGPTALSVAARVRGQMNATRLGFGRQSRVVAADWARMSRTGSWARSGHVVAPRNFPLLALSHDADRLAPPSSIAALAKQFSGAEVSTGHIPGRWGHSGWLRDPSEVVARVTAWMDAREPGE